MPDKLSANEIALSAVEFTLCFQRPSSSSHLQALEQSTHTHTHTGTHSYSHVHSYLYSSIRNHNTLTAASSFARDECRRRERRRRVQRNAIYIANMAGHSTPSGSHEQPSTISHRSSHEQSKQLNSRQHYTQRKTRCQSKQQQAQAGVN